MVMADHPRALVGLAALLVAGSVGTAWGSLRPHHGDPDPGGHIVSAVETAQRAVPAGADIMLRQRGAPTWDSCDGRAGTFGWSEITTSVQFRTPEAPRLLLLNADTAMRSAGWRYATALSSPLGPGEKWTRSVGSSTLATATLAPGTQGNGTYWELDALAPPKAHARNGC